MTTRDMSDMPTDMDGNTIELETYIAPSDPAIRLIRHNTPEEIVSAMFNVEGEQDCDLNECSVGGVDAEGQETECSAQEMCDGIRANGFWGFAATKDNAIHVWEDGTADIYTMLMFLGHEVGHICEHNIATNHPDPDEARADSYGMAAQEAYRMLAELRLNPAAAQNAALRQEVERLRQRITELESK